MGKLISAVASYLGLETEVVKKLSRRAPYAYKNYEIEKNSGQGTRQISQPTMDTKALQYALMHLLLSKIDVHACSCAFEKGIKSPLRHNALAHAPYRFTVRIDLKDFFPSIRPCDLLELPQIQKYGFAKDDMEFLADTLYINLRDGHRGLAIGSPSSPMVSNRIMFTIDDILCKYAQVNMGIYTRYADDMVFSSDTSGACLEFLRKLYSTLKEPNTPRLFINKDKTKFMSRGTKRVVTGLVIRPDGKVSIGKKRKRQIKAKCWEYIQGTLAKKEDISYLSGYLAFIIDVEQTFYDYLALKYGADNIRAILDYREG